MATSKTANLFDGEVLHIIRLDAGLTLKELSQLVGCSTTHLFHIEKGNRPLTQDFKQRVIKAIAQKANHAA